jgi:hypothetical protein
MKGEFACSPGATLAPESSTEYDTIAGNDRADLG